MKINGLQLIIVRGETGNLVLTLTTKQGYPFILPPAEMFSDLLVRFRVKREPYSITTTDYIMNKELPINEGHRFDDETIFNVEEYIAEEGGTYSPLYWAGCTLNGSAEFPNNLFFHPDLKEYAYNVDGEWLLYRGVVINVPFAGLETINLDYGDYYYDVTLEGKNPGAEDHTIVLIPQNKFTISYRV